MAGSSTVDAQAAFYLDLASPEAYLAAERVLSVLPFAAEWIPVRAARSGNVDQAAIERVAAERGLQPLRWPEPLPAAVEPALRAATYARTLGKTVAFCLAAFRQAFAAGRDLRDTDSVVIAGAACEMHPRAVLAAIDRDVIARTLDRVGEEAAARGVLSVPALWLADGRVFHGDAGLDEAARATT